MFQEIEILAARIADCQHANETVARIGWGANMTLAWECLDCGRLGVA